ncbi:hypothetical protein PFISCL1PPCAC_26837 [Pristionchus fissidentatus]|uniref:Caprin-1 dimerization domain-containing protein n=1 Tax=Pristionchus fissidentatus TaxID=1538716 RepID=A0AAV5WVI9_9BILA|nr:hypothetical protein PFISCL1PPCAC_26837 [Pristionchus fissidentatus]
MAAPKPVATSSIKEVDILQYPYSKVVDDIKKETSNLKAKLAQLIALRKRRNEGETLTSAQILGMSSIMEIEGQIKASEEVVNLLNESQKTYDSAKVKKNQANGEQPHQAENTVEEVQETPKETADIFSVIKQLLVHSQILDHLSRPIVRKSFAAGEFGAPKLSEDDFALLDRLHKAYHPTSEACRDRPDFERKLNDAAREVMGIMGEEKNDEWERSRDLLSTLSTSSYFQSLKQNAATKKEKKERKKEEKKEDDEKKKDEKKEENEKKKKNDVNGNKTTKTSSTSNGVSSSSIPSGLSFGYDDSLPHPNQCRKSFAAAAATGVAQPAAASGLQHVQQPPVVVQHGPMQQMQQTQLQQPQHANTFIPNGRQESGWEPGHQGGPYPSGSKDVVVPAEPRHNNNIGHYDHRRSGYMNGMNPMGAQLHHVPPFGMFPNGGIPFPVHGHHFRGSGHHHHQRLPLNPLGHFPFPSGPSLSGLAAPPGWAFAPPPPPFTTSVNSNGQPFRRPANPRYSGSVRAS